MSDFDHAARRLRPSTLPVIKRVHLPQKLRDDAWWLCPAPARPTARVLPFRRNITPARLSAPNLEGSHHD